MIEKIEIVIKNKKEIDKLYEILRKNISKFIMILEETKNEKNISEDDSDNEEVVNVELV